MNAASSDRSRRMSSSTGATSSPAALGVAARASATRSARVTSTSCPTALTTGVGDAAMARATRSSLKHHRSSRDPPPRPTMSTSAPPQRAARLRARTNDCGAVSPCTAAGMTTTSMVGFRRAMTEVMSCSAAPSGLVTTPTVRGNRGIGRFRVASSNPSRSSAARAFSNALRHKPSPSASSARTANCTLARAAHMVSWPYATTCMPSSGAAGRRT